MRKVLTQRSIETVKPRSRRYTIRDGLVPGLFLLVQPSGVKSYALFTRLRGKQIKLTLDGIFTLAQAREWARQQRIQIAQGHDPRAAKQNDQAAAVEIFAIVAHRFIERHCKQHTRRWRATERILNREVLPAWAHRSITSISRRDVIALLDGIVDRGAPVLANRTLAAIRKLFNWCIERGTLEHSPCERVKAPTRETPRERVHSDNELRTIWQAAETLEPVYAAFIKLLVLSGARRNEIAHMRWSELDAELTTWTLPGARTKNHREHVVPLADVVREVLQALPRFAGDYVLTLTGSRPISNFAKIKHDLDAACEPPLPHWTLHDLRRTCASGMARLGIALPVIEKVLNHSSGSFRGIVSTYQRHDYFTEKAQALEAWSSHVLALVREPQHRQSKAQHRSPALV